MDQPCALLELPPELRNAIYRFALVENNAIETKYQVAFVEGYTIKIINKTELKEPSLLATCKTIRGEALALFYAENVFRVWTPPGGMPGRLDWLKAIGVDKASLIRRVEVAFGSPDHRHPIESLIDNADDNPSLFSRVFDSAATEGRSVATSLREAGLSANRVSVAAGQGDSRLKQRYRDVWKEALEDALRSH